MNIDWRITRALNHLAAFEVAVDAGGFTAAAKTLSTTQPSISRHIAALEKLLDVQLFVRLHHRVELTDAGVELYDAVKLGLGHIRSAAHQIARQKDPHELSAALSVGCTYGFAHLWLMPRFSDLQNQITDQQLHMVTADTRTIFDLDEVDFAMRFGKGDWGDGESQKLFGEELFPVCSPEFAEQHFGGCLDIKATSLVDVPLIHEQEEEYSWLSWQKWLVRHDVAYDLPASTYFYDNYALTLQAAMEGRGIALAWRHLAEPPLKSGQLVELTGLRVATDNGYYLAYRRQHPQAEMIVNWFKKMVTQQEALFP